MEMTSEYAGDLQIVTVNSTRIDAAAAIQFKDLMREMTAESNKPVVLDLSQVEFVDSSGLGAIVAAMKFLGKERPLHLSGLTPIVAKVFALTRMDRVFKIFTSVDEAKNLDAARSA